MQFLSKALERFYLAALRMYAVYGLAALFIVHPVLVASGLLAYHLVCYAYEACFDEGDQPKVSIKIQSALTLKLIQGLMFLAYFSLGTTLLASLAAYVGLAGITAGLALPMYYALPAAFCIARHAENLVHAACMLLEASCYLPVSLYQTFTYQSVGPWKVLEVAEEKPYYSEEHLFPGIAHKLATPDWNALLYVHQDPSAPSPRLGG